MKHLKVILVFVLIFSILNQTYADEYAGSEAGSIAYGQQEMNKSGVENSGVGADGSVHYSYPMGDVGLVYGSNDGWKISGYGAITRSTKKGVPYLHGSPISLN